MMNSATYGTLQGRITSYLSHLFVLLLLLLAAIRLELLNNTLALVVVPVIPVFFTAGYFTRGEVRNYLSIAASTAGAYLLIGILNTAALIAILIIYLLILRSGYSTGKKIVLSVIATGILMLIRAGYPELPFLFTAAPVAGSMIMFRYALMLHEHHYTKPETTFAQQLSYLLPLPSLAFPLFPIIDYRSYAGTKHSDDNIVRTGLTRFAAGLGFMLLYRIMYHYVIPSYAEIQSAWDSFLYMTGNYLYVLQVMGILWCGAGLMGIFGYSLPQAFNNIFYIDSFSDVWRRINIYWRDFTAKLVYYPLYFRLRKKHKRAILMTSLISLSVSALLHGWQWFWLQGTIMIGASGILFWTILSLVISINQSMQSPLTNEPREITPAVRAVRITGMFLFMSFMWSLWNSSGLEEWIYFLKKLFTVTWSDLQMILLVVALLFLTVYLLLRFRKKEKGFHPLNQPAPYLVLIAAPAFFITVTFTDVQQLFPVKIKDTAEKILSAGLSAADQSAATENYYSRMLGSDGKGALPWEMHTRGGDARSGLDEACIRRKDLLIRELIPNRTTQAEGWTITTNRWGMRDKDYTLEKPPGTFRIAILGASYEMGSGVSQDSTFEALCEKWINDTLKELKVEILNFSVGGYHLPQLRWIAEEKVPSFQPDLILCFVHPNDASRNSLYLSKLIRNGIDLHYPELYAIRNESGARQGMTEKELNNRLYPFAERIAVWSLQGISDVCDTLGAEFGVVYLPSLKGSEDADYYSELFSNHHSLFSDVIFEDLRHVFGTEPSVYALSSDPNHPNAKGHARIAKALTPALIREVLKTEGESSH